MTIVVDASAIVDAICEFEPAERVFTALDEGGRGYAPAHVDAEVLSALGRLSRAGELERADDRVAAMPAFPVLRYPLSNLTRLAWDLRERVSIRDAFYVVLARTLDASLLTTDLRLARAVRGFVPLA
jgi:predicted nucleic acid-binding protein